MDGWVKGCKPIIDMDGCHLKGKYREVWMTMVGLDTDNGLFPTTIHITKTENTTSWEDFMNILAPELTRHPKPLTIM